MLANRGHVERIDLRLQIPGAPLAHVASAKARAGSPVPLVIRAEPGARESVPYQPVGPARTTGWASSSSSACRDG